MARIAGVDIPREKRVEISLTYIYGIGRTLSNKILKKVEENDTEILEKTRFFSAVVLYSDIAKVLTLYLLLMLIIK